MKFSVSFLSEAQVDLEVIHSYLADKSPQGAEKWLAAFENAITQLENHPERFSLAPEASFVTKKVQNIVFKTKKGRPYRLVYITVKDEVRVLRLLGPGHDSLRVDELT